MELYELPLFNVPERAFILKYCSYEFGAVISKKDEKFEMKNFYCDITKENFLKLDLSSENIHKNIDDYIIFFLTEFSKMYDYCPVVVRKEKNDLFFLTTKWEERKIHQEVGRVYRCPINDVKNFDYLLENSGKKRTQYEKKKI